MNEIEILKTLYKKSCRMENGRLKGGFIDMESPENKAINFAIAALEAQQADRWIPCEERLPEEKVNPFTGDYCEYECTADFGCGGLDIRYYKFGRGHWYENGDCLDKCVTAWRERPEPYDPLAEKIQKVLDREHERISGGKSK